MGRSWTDVYQLGREYTFGKVVYLAFKEVNNKVYFKKSYDKYLDIDRFKRAKPIIMRSQRARPDRSEDKTYGVYGVDAWVEGDRGYKSSYRKR